jgi:hypothetical protein
MCVFARRIEHPLDVAVQCPHDSDAHHHGRPVELDDQEQGFDSGLPFLEILLSLRQFHGVVGGVAQRHQLAPARQQDGIIQSAGQGGSGPGSCDLLSAFRDAPSAEVAFFFAASTVALSGQIVPLS